MDKFLDMKATSATPSVELTGDLPMSDSESETEQQVRKHASSKRNKLGLDTGKKSSRRMTLPQGLCVR
jgi:hypothetical protein